MSDLGNKEIFAKNLKYYMDINKKDRMDISRDLEIPYTTVTSWYNAEFYPRIDKIELLANYFDIKKSDLVEKKEKKEVLSHNITFLPVYGKISAGEPVLAEQYLETYIAVDKKISGIDNSDDFFYLRVNGESMNKKVLNGEYVLIHKQDYAEDGDIIVAIVNGNDEATLKKFKKLNDQFVLLEPMSSDPTFEPITVDLKSTTFRIIGKATGHFGRW